MICSIIWVTLGYIAAVGLIVISQLDSLLAKMSNMLLVTLAVTVIMGYIVLVVIYSIISNHIYNKKHKEARFRVKKYNHNLIKLLKMYEKERK